MNQELQTTNRNYMEMLGFVAHELKNPLASATLSLYTVKDGYLGDMNPAQQRSLESVATSLDYFGEMIRNYLDLSRLEKGELRINKTRVSTWAQPSSPGHGRVGAGVPGNEDGGGESHAGYLELNADRDLLRVVYDNLLSNAVKYGREGGQVTLEASNSGGELQLSVIQRGCGRAG